MFIWLFTPTLCFRVSAYLVMFMVIIAYLWRFLVDSTEFMFYATRSDENIFSHNFRHRSCSILSVLQFSYTKFFLFPHRFHDTYKTVGIALNFQHILYEMRLNAMSWCMIRPIRPLHSLVTNEKCGGINVSHYQCN